jgi:phospholipid/cholesterol/gamma-HCH transport system permease protein
MLGRTDRKFFRRLRAMAENPNNTWDLTAVDALDSAGAVFLWRAWDGSKPKAFQVSDEHRVLFDHLEHIDLVVSPPEYHWLAPLQALGAWLVDIALQIAGMLLLAGQLVIDTLYCLRHPRALPLHEISATVYRAGVQALPLLTFVGLITGVVLTDQIAGELVQFGQSTAVVGAVGLGFLRELGPFVAGIIIVGRSGSSFTAEIAAMRMTGEIDALKAFGCSPTLRLVLPKVLGLALAMPLLVVWTNFCGIIGAILVSTAKLNVTYGMWLVMFPDAVPWSDFIIGFGKGILFGGLIGLVASYYGLSAASNTQSLTMNTTRSVVFNLAMVLTLDGILGVVMSGVGLG